MEGGRRGVVRYVGRVEGLPLGWWVGVQVRAGWAGEWVEKVGGGAGREATAPCLVAAAPQETPPE